jgi:hypothetical protein
MKCKNCGKEIPDDAKFCGFCGTPVEIEAEPENKAEGTVTDAPVTEEPAAETPITETPAAETADNTSGEVPPSLGSQVGDKLKETAAGKAVLGEDGKLDKEDFARIGNAAKEGAVNAYQSVDWKEFKTFLDIFKDPFGEHALGLIPSIVVLVVSVIVNCFLLNFLDACVITLLPLAGLFLVLYINKTEEHFDGKKAFGRAAQLLTLPVCSMILVLIFSISMKNTFNGTGLMINGMTQYLYALRSSVMIILIFLIFATVMYTSGMVEAGKKMNKYLLALIITAVFVACLFIMITQGLSSLIN